MSYTIDVVNTFGGNSILLVSLFNSGIQIGNDVEIISGGTENFPLDWETEHLEIRFKDQENELKDHHRIILPNHAFWSIDRRSFKGKMELKWGKLEAKIVQFIRVSGENETDPYKPKWTLKVKRPSHYFNDADSKLVGANDNVTVSDDGG